MVTRRISVIFDSNTSSLVKGFKESAKAGEEAAESLGTFGEFLDKNEKSISTAGKTLTAFGATGTAALVGSTKAAIDWDSAWAGVTKTVEGTDEQMTSLEAGLREMARTMPATHTEIAAVAEAAGQLGVQTESIESFTKTMIDLGETTNLTADEAATSIAQLMNVMQTAPDDVDNLGSALVALGNDGASTERQIIQMAQGMAGAAAIVGMTEAEVLAVANAFASVGIEAEAGGTAFSRIITNMAQSVSTGSEELATFAEVAGMSAQEFARAFSEDPTQAFATFIQGLSEVHSAGGDVFSILEELGMSDIRVSRALLGMATSGDLLTESLELGAAAWEENIALTDEADKRYETAAARISIAWNNIKDAAVSAGDVILPLVAGVSDVIADVAGAIAEMPGPVQAAFVALTGVGTAVSLVAGGALLLVPRIRDTVSAFRDLRGMSDRLPSSVGRVGSAIGKVTAVLGGVGLLMALSSAGREMNDFTRSTEDAEQALIRFRETSDLGDLFSVDLSQSEFSRSLRELGDNSAWRGLHENLADFGDGLGAFVGMDTRSDFYTLRDDLASLDNVLGEMASTSLPDAAEAFADVAAMTDGSDASIRALLDSTPQYEAALKSAANEQGKALTDAELLALALGKIHLESENAAGGAGQLEGETGPLADGLEDVESAAADAEQSLSDLQGILTSMGSPFRDVRQAARDYEQSLIDLEAAMGEDGWKATLDITTEAGIANQEMLDGLAATTLEYAASAAGAGASSEELGVIVSNGRQDFINIAEAMGLSSIEAEALADKMELIPDEVVTEVQASGIPQFEEDVTSVRDWVGTLEARVQLGVDDTPAKSGVQELSDSLFYRDPMSVPLDADDAPARETITSTVQFALEQNGVMGLDADGTLAYVRIDDWNAAAANTTGMPHLDADPAKARQQLAEYVGSAAVTTATAILDANGAPAKGATDAWWYRSENTTATATLDAWNGPAFSALNAFLNSIPNSVSVAIRGVPIVGGLFGRFADGGITVPYANGGVSDQGTVARIPQMAGPEYGKTNIRWAEEETHWEAYISGKPGMEERNRGILMVAADRLGLEVIDHRRTRHFADGEILANPITLPQVRVAPQQISGMKISGRLDLGNGLSGFVDGRIEAAEEYRNYSERLG